MQIDGNYDFFSISLFIQPIDSANINFQPEPVVIIRLREYVNKIENEIRHQRSIEQQL